MQRRTAWLIAQTYGELVGIDKSEAAFKLLILQQASEDVDMVLPQL